MPTEIRNSRGEARAVALLAISVDYSQPLAMKEQEFQEEAQFSRILYKREGRTPPPHYPSLQTHFELSDVSSFRPKLSKSHSDGGGGVGGENKLPMPGTEGSGLSRVDTLHHRMILEMFSS